MTTIDILKKAKEAKKSLALITNSDIDNALKIISERLVLNSEYILSANKDDIENAKSKYNDVMLDRLLLTKERIVSMAEGIINVSKLESPNGKIIDSFVRPNGLLIEKRLVPMGVIAVIYESRPNVTSDVAALCLKSGNVAVLRSGKEAWKTSNAIVTVIKNALKETGLSEDCVNLIEDTSRESVNELLNAVDYLDLLIPRGGAGLIKAVTENAKVPCVKTGTGICHIYVDESADVPMALEIIENAKTSRPSVCNAEEVCLVNENIAREFLPLLKKKLYDERLENGKIPVELRLCEKSQKLISGVPCNENDFDTEFLNYILAVKIVKNVDEAIDHISNHSTGHSESIITNDEESKIKFQSLVDSAAVYVNASTRFTDGGEFGLGCEIGISTQKLHARGPMGLNELCTYKYVIHGNGQIRK